MRKGIFLLFLVLLSGCFIDRRDNLINATRNLDYNRVKIFVTAGADLNEKDNNGFTPLIIASYYGNAPIVKYLCENGANLNIQDNDGWTALIYASYYQFEDVVQILLLYHPDFNLVNKYGYSALWYAEKNHNEKIANWLKDKGAKPLF
jgi:ankyrin repeat protein